MSTTTINFTMKDLDGTVVPFKTFEISSGRLNTGEIPGTIPPNVFFTTNEHGKATVTLTVTAAPYYIAKIDGATEKVIAYKFFVPESSTPLEAEMLYVDLGKKNQQFNDKTLAALIEAKVVTLNAANSAITIASMLGNMESIRDGIPNIIAVGAHIEDIGLLADNAANIATIGTNISNVNTVANNSSAINTVATNNANIASVAQSISNVDSVAGMSSNISSVLANATNINAVASAANNIGTVATNITSVNTVAASNASVLAAANNIAAITHVGNNIANIAAVGSNIASINSVSAMSADIDLIIADMDAVVDAAAAVTQSIDAQKQLYIAGTDYTKNSTSQLVLAYFPAKPNSIKIFFDGIYQNKDKWSLFSKTVIFGLPISSNAVEVHYEVPSQFVSLSVEEQATLATAQTNTLANANNATAQRAAAEAAKLAAESARDTAVSSANSATASASTATSAANAASTAASTATTQASNTSTFATNAANSALSASGSAIAAAGSASAAQTIKTDIETIVAAIPDGTINDSTTSLIDVWSSNKVSSKFDEKQDTLISGTNIKTLNGVSILGSGDLSVSTSVPEVKTPTNTSPVIAATGITEASTLTASTYGTLYGIAMAASQWQVSTVSNFASIVLDTGDVAGTSTSYTLAGGLFSTNTVYYWRCRYKDALGSYSDWSVATSFTTAASFNAYIATPTATPAAFGDALDGGFYAGMVWGQLTQSSTSAAIGTGSRTFTVPSMTAAPIVYGGQTVEVRSRANPANKFVGTVTGAAGTNLTINVTSIGGGGTFSDWSVMARHRVIVAPKASGEHAGIALKNANTALPTACQTLTEGFTATQAMRDADTSTVYPAAHWARNLNIGGRTDWCIPARDELELCWRNLKPTTTANYVTADRPTAAIFSYANNGSYGDTANTHGTNNNSSPTGAAYTPSVPGQTAATAFRTGGAEAYEFGSAYYWSSSDYNASYAWFQGWYSSNPGFQSNHGKTNSFRVRAVRRSVI